jgi:hypothetical protein
MLKRISFVIFSFLLTTLNLSVESSNGDDGHWVKQAVKDGFTIYLRKKANTSILPLRIEGVINAPVDYIMENLRKVDGSEDWTPDLLQKITLEDVNPSIAITFSLTDMPWPIYDRRLILHNELRLDKERKLLFVVSKSMAFPGAPVPERTVEAFVGYSSIGFRPVSKDKTYVELTAFIDPKGSIPHWVINFYQKSWPIKFLRALENRSQTHRVKLRPGLKPMLQELLQIMQWDKTSFDRLGDGRP